MKSAKRIIIRIIVFVYLIRIISAATYLDNYLPDSSLGRFLAIFSDYSRSNWSYGFFSHEVGLTNELQIKLYKLNSTEPYKVLETNKNFNFFSKNVENSIRYYGFKGRYSSDTLSQELLSKSIALKFLNANPECGRVDIEINKNLYPDLYGKRGDTILKENYYKAHISMK